MGYHKQKIEKGVLGKFSKIKEEFLELQDAHDQKNPVLELCELCDLIGAIEAYSSKYNITLDDLIAMKKLTQSAFIEGKRE
jgi:hypothetical protein